MVEDLKPTLFRGWREQFTQEGTSGLPLQIPHRGGEFHAVIYQNQTRLWFL